MENSHNNSMQEELKQKEDKDELEDIYLAEKRLEDIRAGKTKTIPLEETMKRHGL